MADSSAPARPARQAIRTVVSRVDRVSDHLLRVVLGGPGLQGFPAGAFTDHYVKLLFPPPGAPYGPDFDVAEVRATLPRSQWPRTRTYTVREWDPERTELTVDVVQHGDAGLAGPWAAAARPGDVLQLLGPGGAYAPDPEADWHLLVGDASVLPAIAASLRRIPAGVPVHVVAEVHDEAEQQELQSPGDLTTTWVHRGDAGALPPSDEPLVVAVRELEFPDGRVHAFVHGEAVAVRELRRHLLADRGMPRQDVSISGYWKRTLDEDGWQSSKAEWNAEVEADVS
ncbi:siderophore-interacting protein [Patulibacter sp.]|uniref:siderophore-interacting protein n=1 Tax=Patulibacter sp. TaxID=1912859 RepID=UPI00271E911B|nr:siderophore-interacting protein [Patulibacter sp.]MDO9408279.1 siderophore-interacting protein [Patulibacter sp.]